MLLDGKRILVTGGTGSLGQVLVRRLLTGEMGWPKKIVVFSRDEAKQHYMRLNYLHRKVATDDVIYKNSKELLAFRIGDVRDYSSFLRAACDADVVFNAAALKQVPSCEYFPYEAVQTNIIGAHNLVRAIKEGGAGIELVVGVSTDKACKPINVMGMTKAIQERVLIQANMECAKTRFVCVRYGNVVASRGSVVPVFLEQIVRGGPVTITMKEMTRFLLTLDQAVSTIFAAVKSGERGDTYIPIVPAARMVDVARILMDGKDIPIVYTGIRPGEKVHEILVSEEESYRTVLREGYYVIRSILPEVADTIGQKKVIDREYSSSNVNLSDEELKTLLNPYLNQKEVEVLM